MRHRNETWLIPMFFSWSALVLTHWLAVTVLLNLCYDANLESLWSQVKWTQADFHVRHFLVVATLVGILVSSWIALGLQIIITACAKCSPWWSFVWTFLFIAPLVEAIPFVELHVKATTNQPQYPANYYNKGGDGSHNSQSRTPLAHTGPAILLFDLGILFFLGLRIDLKRSVANLLRLAVLLAIALAIIKVWINGFWISWSDIVVATGLFAGAFLPIYGAYAWNWQRKELLPIVGYWVFLLAILAGFMCPAVASGNPVYGFALLLILGFVGFQLVLGVFLWFDLQRPIFDFRANISGPLNNRPVTIPFAVGFLLLAFAASQATWRLFADRYNPTVLLLAKERRWELASFVADLKRFHRRHRQQNKNSLTHIMFEAVSMSKGELDLALATKPLVDHEQWEAFQNRLSEFGADPYWVHDYPVADTRHFNPRHWINHIDGEAFPCRDWYRIASANTSRELTIHGGSYRLNDLLRAPKQIGSLLLVNPKIEHDFDASVIRQFNNFTVWVDTIEPLLKNPRLLVELAHNGAYLLVRNQSTTEVQTLIETADFELDKCLKVSSVQEYGTRVDPMPRTKSSIHVDSVLENLETSSWSTDSQGQTTGVRLGPDGVLPEISGSVGTVPKNSIRKSLRWLYIDCIKHGSVRNIDPALQELIPNAKLVIANQIGRLDDLRQLLSNARTAGNLRTKSLQLSWHEGYGIDIARDLDDYPGITTLFIEYTPVQFDGLFATLSCWTNLERLVMIASPTSIDELAQMDSRCDAIYDGPVNLTEILQSMAKPQERLPVLRPVAGLPFEVFVVPRTISNNEMVELIAEPN